MKKLTIKIEGDADSGKTSLVNAIIEMVGANTIPNFKNVQCVLHEEGRGADMLTITHGRPDTFKNANGQDIEGSQRDYNDGYMRGVKMYQDHGYAAHTAIAGFISGELNESYNYGLRDAEKFFSVRMSED